MSATQREEETRPSNRALRLIAVLAVVTLMLFLPGALAVVESAHAPETSTNGASGLSAAWEKPVDFVETGLPAGTEWSVNLSGTLGSSDTTTIAFSEIPGTYPFSVTPVTGYTASPSSGTVDVTSCMGATVDITFTPVSVPTSYSVFFNETGLTAGTTWWVNLSGTNLSSSSPSIVFTELNGTYLFTAPAIISGPAGVQFLTGTNNGTVVVNGANVSVAVPYSTQYYLTTIASPPGGGSVTPASGWYAAGAIVSLDAVPSAGYTFLNWTGTGTGNYTGTSATPTIAMNSPIVENASFGLSYAVDFEETGLPDGVTWAVTFDGVTQSSFFVFLDFSAVNGTYAYNVTPLPGYHADIYQGTVTVAGSSVTVTIQWVRVTYNVTFVESGLPGGTMWTVSVNGSSESSSTSTILFIESNYTYPWSVTPISGYTSNVTGGTLVVNGANLEILISWTATAPPTATYTVTFVETGLVAGTAWSVTLNGTASTPGSSTGTTIVFSGLADGTYQYWVPSVGTYSPAVVHDTVVVSGADVTVQVTFSAVSPPVHTAVSLQISVWDLLILAFITGGGIVVTYVIFRRS